MRRLAFILVFLFICVPCWSDNNVITYEQGFVKELTFEKNLGEIYISNPNTVNVQVISKNRIILVAEGVGDSVLRIKDKNGVDLIFANISVVPKLRELREMIQDLYPNIEISVKPNKNVVFLLGRVPSPKIAKDIQNISQKFFGTDNSNNIQLINKLIIDLPIQVMLKVKIVELSRSVSKNLGIEWHMNGVPTGELGVALGASVNPSTLTQAIFDNPNLTASAISLSGNDDNKSGSLFSKLSQGLLTGWSFKNGNFLMDINSLLNVLQDDNLTTVLAEPTIVALSGKKAEFSSGGKQPYNTSVVSAAATSQQVNFVEYGVELTFTPTVISENLITIDLSKCEVTMPGMGPDSTTRSIVTTVQVANGQTVAIAGLIKKDYFTSKSKNGFLANLPLIGDLFAPNSSLSSNEVELVITITPYIIKPVKETMYYPTSGVTSVNKTNNGVEKYDKNKGMTSGMKDNILGVLNEMEDTH